MWQTLREFHYQSRCMQMIEAHEAQVRGGLQYERVLFTRLEMIWLQPHPPLSLLDPSLVWVPAGEDNGGINDRHWLAGRAHARHMMRRYDARQDATYIMSGQCHRLMPHAIRPLCVPMHMPVHMHHAPCTCTMYHACAHAHAHAYPHSLGGSRCSMAPPSWPSMDPRERRRRCSPPHLVGEPASFLRVCLVRVCLLGCMQMHVHLQVHPRFLSSEMYLYHHMRHHRVPIGRFPMLSYLACCEDIYRDAQGRLIGSDQSVDAVLSTGTHPPPTPSRSASDSCPPALTQPSYLTTSPRDACCAQVKARSTATRATSARRARAFSRTVTASDARLQRRSTRWVPHARRHLRSYRVLYAQCPCYMLRAACRAPLVVRHMSCAACHVRVHVN